MPLLELEFEVFCSCGNGMCNSTTEGRNGHSQFIEVEPCGKRLEASRNEGYNEGYEEGYAQAKEDIGEDG